MFCIVFLSVLFLVRCGPKTLVYARKNMLPERFIKFIKNILFVKKIVVDQKIKVQGTLISGYMRPSFGSFAVCIVL